MKKLIVTLLGVVLSFSAARGITTQEATAAIDRAAAAGHPRLFGNATAFKTIKTRAQSEELYILASKKIIACADLTCAQPPVTRTKTGRRLLTISRIALYRITHLAMAYHFTNDAKYLKRAEQELVAVCEFSDWNPDHFLDVAEMTLACALGYDWLFDALSSEVKAKVETAMVKFGLEEARKKAHWPFKGKNNWTQVCNCGMAAAALALAEKQDLKEINTFTIKRAVNNMPDPMKEYAPNGCYPEGPVYWSYGTDFCVAFIAMMKSATGSDYGLLSIPGFMETADYHNLVTGPSLYLFNTSDCSTTKFYSDCAHWFFAQRLSRRDLLEPFELEAFRKYVATPVTDDKTRNRTFTWTLFWMDFFEISRRAAPLCWESKGVCPITIQRSDWTREAFFVGLKGGSPSAPHGHQDAGSFVMDTGNVRWAYDIGAENYNKIEQLGIDLWNFKQNSGRWSVYRLNVASHNTLMINGQDQWVKGNATASIDGQKAIIDLTSIYTNASKVVRVGELVSNKCYRMTDTLEGLAVGAKVRWAMMTKAAVEHEGNDLLLKESGKVLHLHVDGVPAAWQVVENPHPKKYDTENKGFRQITFTTTAQQPVLKWTVTFTLQ